MVRKGNLAILKANEKWAKSLKPEWPCPPKLVCIHFTSNSTCLNFLSQFYFWLPWTIVCGSKGTFDHFEGKQKTSKISKIVVVMPMHQNWFACISHQLLLAWIYEPILFFDPHGLYPWSARAIWPFWRQTKMSKSLRPEWPCTPKLVCMHFTSTSTCLNFLTPTGLL